jgi:hypothetical protein
VFNRSESPIGLFELLAKRPIDRSKVHISIDMNFELLVLDDCYPLKQQLI